MVTTKRMCIDVCMILCRNQVTSPPTHISGIKVHQVHVHIMCMRAYICDGMYARHWHG